MKSPTDLYYLIKSLTPSEKGYFKKYAAAGEGKKYLKLFDAINAQKEYDEEKLKKKFKKELSNLSAAKNYLFEMVVDATRAFQLNNSHSSQILRLTDQGDLLFKRGLYEAAQNKYAEAYQKAVAILSYKHAILPRWGFIECCFYTRLDSLLPVSKMIALDNKILHEAWLDFGHQQFAAIRWERYSKAGNPHTKNMLEESGSAYRAHFKLLENKTGESEWGIIKHHQRKAFFALENQKYIQMLKYTLVCLKIFLKYPLLKTASPDAYFDGLLNLMNSYAAVFMEEEKRFLHKYIKNESNRLKLYLNRPLQLIVESRLYNLVIVDYMRYRTTSDLDQLFTEILPWFRKNKKRLEITSAGRFMIWYMYHLFNKGDYRELLFRCNEFLYDKSTAYSQFQRASVLLIYLTVYLEQGDWDILPAKLKESYRLLKEETTNNEAVLLVVRLVDKVIKENKQLELKPTLQKLKEDMEERKIKEHIFAPFRFEIWLGSKLEGIPYQEMALRVKNSYKIRKPLETFEEELKIEGLTREDLRLPLMVESSVASAATNKKDRR